LISDFESATSLIASSMDTSETSKGVSINYSFLINQFQPKNVANATNFAKLHKVDLAHLLNFCSLVNKGDSIVSCDSSENSSNTVVTGSTSPEWDFSVTPKGNYFRHTSIGSDYSLT
jgi:hypothetical protein